MTTVISLLGRGLKINPSSDMQAHLSDFDPTMIEEIHLGRHTIGVEAAQAVEAFLAKTTKLKVRNYTQLRLTCI